jgi:hypothetical protein
MLQLSSPVIVAEGQGSRRGLLTGFLTVVLRFCFKILRTFEWEAG